MVWVLDKTAAPCFWSFFILFFLVHCLIHAYDCHADGWGIYFLTTFLLGDSGITSVSKKRGSPFLVGTWLLKLSICIQQGFN